MRAFVAARAVCDVLRDPKFQDGSQPKDFGTLECGPLSGELEGEDRQPEQFANTPRLTRNFLNLN